MMREVARKVAELCGLPAPHEPFLESAAPVVKQLRRRQFISDFVRPFHDEGVEALRREDLRRVLAGPPNPTAFNSAATRSCLLARTRWFRHVRDRFSGRNKCGLAAPAETLSPVQPALADCCAAASRRKTQGGTRWLSARACWRAGHSASRSASERGLLTRRQSDSASTSSRSTGLNSRGTRRALAGRLPPDLEKPTGAHRYILQCAGCGGRSCAKRRPGHDHKVECRDLTPLRLLNGGRQMPTPRWSANLSSSETSRRLLHARPCPNNPPTKLQAPCPCRGVCQGAEPSSTNAIGLAECLSMRLCPEETSSSLLTSAPSDFGALRRSQFAELGHQHLGR